MFSLQIPNPVPASRYNYDWAFARAERTLAQHLAHGSPSARLPERLAELDRLPEGEQIRRASAGRFSDPSFIECLLDRSRAARYQSPRKTLHFALLARLAADACVVERAGGERMLADMQAKAWGAFANARRICGDLLGAEEALTIALRRYDQGTGSLHERASLLSKLGALRFFQRRVKEALDLADEARQIYQALGDLHLEAGTLVQKAIALLYSGEAEAAASLLQQVIPSIDPDEDPHLLLAARHNLFHCYVELGRPDEALALHVESRDLYQECNDLLILLRAAWDEGKLLGEIGHLHNAEAALVRAHRGFAEQNLAYETAMVSLDLADIYWKLGRFEDLRRTLADALPIFRSLRVEPGSIWLPSSGSSRQPRRSPRSPGDQFRPFSSFQVRRRERAARTTFRLWSKRRSSYTLQGVTLHGSLQPRPFGKSGHGGILGFKAVQPGEKVGRRRAHQRQDLQDVLEAQPQVALEQARRRPGSQPRRSSRVSRGSAALDDQLP